MTICSNACPVLLAPSSGMGSEDARIRFIRGLGAGLGGGGVHQRGRSGPQGGCCSGGPGRWEEPGSEQGCQSAGLLPTNASDSIRIVAKLTHITFTLFVSHYILLSGLWVSHLPVQVFRVYRRQGGAIGHLIAVSDSCIVDAYDTWFPWNTASPDSQGCW